MKSWYIILIMLCSAGWLHAALSIRVEPAQVIAGEPASFCIVNTEEEVPRVASLPKLKHLDWLAKTPDVRKSFSSINGTTSMEIVAAYPFIVTRPGELRIPRLSVTVGSRKYDTAPCKIVVRERKYAVDNKDGEISEQRLDDLIYQRVQVPTDRKSFYIGEEIPLDIKVFISTGLKFNLGNWPHLEIDKVVFKDFSQANPQNRNFAPFQRQVETIDSRDFVVFSFHTVFRAIADGTVSGKVVTDGEVIVRSNRAPQERDDFFGMMAMMDDRYRSLPRKLTTDIPALKIVPLPAVPRDETFIGLVGTWRTLIELSSTHPRMGEAFTLRIKFSGVGSPENLIAPKLELPDFRVYPPEIERHYDPETNRCNGEIRYTLVPLAEGPAAIKLTLCYFDTVTGKYRSVPFAQKLQVAKADSQTSVDNVFVGANPPPVDGDQMATPAGSAKKKNSGDTLGILSLQRYPNGTVALPLWENHLGWLITLLLAGPLFWGLMELRHRRRQALECDPLKRRHQEALHRRGLVVKAIRNAAPDHLDEVIRTEAVPYFNDYLGLPPGTDGSGLAEQIDEPQLAAALRDANNAGYMPGAIAMDKKQLRDIILKGLKRLSLIALLFAAGNLVAGSIPANNDAAMTAYDRGDYGVAAAYYASHIDAHNPAPGLLYNLGNCYCRSKEFAKALLCYEKAWRLAPGDSDIVENLNFVHRKLLLPEVGQTGNPMDWLRVGRDQLRPDEWLLLGAFGWLALFVALGFRRQLRRGIWTILVPAVLVMGWSGVCAVWQYNGSYCNDETAIILAARPQVMQLPADSAEPADFRLHRGQQVTILERRSGWVRIKVDGNGEGWIKEDAMAAIWGDDAIRDWNRLFPAP